MHWKSGFAYGQVAENQKVTEFLLFTPVALLSWLNKCWKEFFYHLPSEVPEILALGLFCSIQGSVPPLSGV